MSDADPLLEQIFFQIFEPLPRQGPGSRECTARALALCDGLPEAPAVLDLGCGSGAQTLDLAELTTGTVVAVDLHPPNVARLRAAVRARGLASRVRPLVADMARLPLPPRSLDLLWSEGALYNVGLERGLALCRDQLRPGGWLAFTDAVWRAPDPPAEVRASFADYPTMGTVPDALRRIEAGGFALAGHFPLPDAAWWDEFYEPMQRRIDALRAEYAGDAAALSALEELAAEPAMHRRHGRCYGYEFFVARRT